jgi:hypothetical protein
MILTTCFLLMAATLEIRAENAADVSTEYSELFKSKVETLALSTNCESVGVFAINCTSYLVCFHFEGYLIGFEVTCPSQQNFDPQNKLCSSSYICSSCDKTGFLCPTSTSYSLCAETGLEIIRNQPCPNGYYCNPKCIFPCLNYIPSC